MAAKRGRSLYELIVVRRQLGSISENGEGLRVRPQQEATCHSSLDLISDDPQRSQFAGGEDAANAGGNGQDAASVRLRSMDACRFR